MNHEEFLKFISGFNFCWCGMPRSALLLLRSLLRLHAEPGPSAQEEFKALIPDEGTRYLLMYWMDSQHLTARESSGGCKGLSQTGKKLLEYLAPLSDQEISTLASSL